MDPAPQADGSPEAGAHLGESERPTPAWPAGVPCPHRCPPRPGPGAADAFSSRGHRSPEPPARFPALPAHVLGWPWWHAPVPGLVTAVGSGLKAALPARKMGARTAARAGAPAGRVSALQMWTGCTGASGQGPVCCQTEHLG